MGNRNKKNLLRPSYDVHVFHPSWGTGTWRAAVAETGLGRLPTPHGEQERRLLNLLWKLPNSSNPSWGTGTIQSLTNVGGTLDFQPLMGNRNASPVCSYERPTAIPTPHGEQELTEMALLLTLSNAFQPLMGNRNANPAIITFAANHLPTPHGEQELFDRLRRPM